MNRVFPVLLILAFAVLGFCAGGARAHEFEHPQDATYRYLAEWAELAKLYGYLPPWADLGDTWKVVDRDREGEAVRYFCVTDAGTGQRTVTWGDRVILQGLADGTIAPFRGPQHAPVDADWVACGWSPPRPRALGGPAYWWLPCADMACQVVNWPVLAAAENRAGTVEPGEPCGERDPKPPSGAWYTIPRLGSPGGLQPVTLCAWSAADL